MNSAEIKMDLFRKLDSLKGNRLEEAYGMLMNYINGKTDFDDWQNMTLEQQTAIEQGIYQLEKGEGRRHENVISEIRARYAEE